jgi:hypothetical protein
MSATRNSRSQVFCWSDRTRRFLNGLRRMSNGMLHRFSVVSYVTGQLSIVALKLMFALEFLWIPFVNLFEGFLSFSSFSIFFLHVPFIFLSLDSMSLRLVRTVVAAGLGSYLHNCRQGNHRKQMSKRQDTPGQTNNSSLPASQRADRARKIAPGWLLLILLLRNPEVFRRRLVSADFSLTDLGYLPGACGPHAAGPPGAGGLERWTLNEEILRIQVEDVQECQGCTEKIRYTQVI